MNMIKVTLTAAVFAVGFQVAQVRAELDISQYPLFAGIEIAPKVMLSMSVDHQLFFEAYNEYTDLTGDGFPDTTYNHQVDYFGYFDSYKCYNYLNGEFLPQSVTSNKYCNGNWSGNFLNWVTTARIDAVRKLLFGGFRSVDTASRTVLERTHLPNDAHSWARYYDGDDLGQLTPFSNQANPSPLTVTHAVNSETWDSWRTIFPGTTNNRVNYALRTISFTGSFPGHPGDAVFLEEPGTDRVIQGYIKDRPATNQVRLVVVYAEGRSGDPSNTWVMSNRSRSGITFCNTTQGGSARSQDTTAPPLLRVARGNYTMWGANERFQCKWSEEDRNRLAGRSDGVPYNAEMEPNSNANIAAITGIMAATDNPSRALVRLGGSDLNVRVEVCNPSFPEDNCKQYGSSYKPVGLLQNFGERDRMLFGMVSGSYARNRSGGVLRKPIGSINDEINPEDGTFTGVDGIIRSMNALRIFGYRHDNGTYHNNNHGGGDATTDRCLWGTRSFDDGHCSNWGNPQSEIFLESLRYLAGLEEPRFDADDSGRLTGLTTAEWDDPVPEALWCSPLSIVQFNASTSSFDADLLNYASDIGLNDLDSWTNSVGDGEGITGGEFFVGQVGTNNDEVCTAKTVTSLSDVRGICPEAPRLQGSYHIAGLAYYAWMNDMRPDRQGVQNIMTQGVELAPAVPRVSVIDANGSEVATILPSCREFRSAATPQLGSCAIVDFKVVNQQVTPSGSIGQFFVQWEDTEHGGDYDMDMTGILRYELQGDNLVVSTRVFGDSSSGQMAFGYVLSGTSDDGFHAHSGIGGFNHESHCQLDAINCRTLAPETSRTYTLGGSSADMMRPPLFYAAKWGGFDRSGGATAPLDTSTWDRDGDGIPDTYHFATDPASLQESLARAFEIILEAGSATSVASDSTRLETGTFVYQASFESDDWSGELIALDPSEDNSVVWRASERLAAQAQNLATRAARVFTYDPETGARGQGRLLNSSYVLDRLENAPNLPPGNYDLSALIEYLLGDRANEESQGGPFRDRGGVLGDIVNSQIVLSATRNEGWWRLGDDIGAEYLEHVQAKVDAERSVIFVGANDGMLHAFNGKDGTPYFSYAPSAVLDNLPEYADPNYGHRFFVDGQLAVADAYIPDRGGWRTVLIGALAAGGKGVFALDVTNPQSFTVDDVLWEFTDQRNNIDDSIGHVWGTPTITRMKDGTWVTIIGNGYNSAGGKAGLVIIDLATGRTITNGFVEVDIPSNQRPDFNGLSSPGLWLETGRQRYVERAYAGDLTGRMWRFDLDGSQPRLSSEFSRGLLFHAETGSGNNRRGQPITISPTVAASPSGGLWVLFGTGKLIETADVEIIENPPVDTFYALLDRNAAVSRGSLGEVELGVDMDTGLRTAELDGDPGSQGWFVNLTTGTNSGERVLSRPDILFGRVIFTTFEPVEDPCLGGGIPRIYVLNASNGQGELGTNPDCPFCAGAAIPDTGAPVAPPTVIRPPAVTQPGDGTPPVPGLPPLEPVDPDAPPPLVPGAGTGGDRSDWCSEFGYVNPVDLSFVPLGRVCDGRQIWRQVR